MSIMKANPEEYYRRLYRLAKEPLSCGHPGACLSNETNTCLWCADLKPKTKRGRKPSGYVDVLSEHQAEQFSKIWEAWPTRREDDGKPAKGGKFQAMEAFASAILSGATPEQLVQAGARYLTTYHEDRGGFLQFVSTFYGPQKRTYMSYLED